MVIRVYRGVSGVFKVISKAINKVINKVIIKSLIRRVTQQSLLVGFDISRVRY